MARNDLAQRSVSSYSVCGKMLRRGQTILVDATAIGPREKKMEKRGKIRISASNKKGKVQIRAL
jgi:hypothetical protein